MRITNKIMQRNNLSNINTNKVYQDKLSTQMSTQKKVSRPSDDPVVSIRALRLRSNVTEVTQYYSKNIPDAESWLDVTEDALKNLTEIITNMIQQCTKASNGDLKSADRQIILEQLKALGDEVYSTGDADYAGRYVFTGYRTDTSLSFDKEYNTKYEITEQLDNSSITQLTKVNTGKLLDITANNYNDQNQDYKDITENSVSSIDVYRIRLAYDDCKEGGNVKIKFGTTELSTADTIRATTSTANPDPYTDIKKYPNGAIYVADTGELLIGKDLYNQMMACKDDPATSDKNEGEIQITYEKDHWVKGDLRPEHYFACTSTDADGKVTDYNKSYLDGKSEKQVIEYDVGFNQTIQVNSTADECFQHGIGRTVDDLVQAMQDVVDLENVKTKIEGLQETATGTDAETLTKQMEAVEKALTLAKDKCQKMFESGITTFQGYLDDANLCVTNCGTRSSKLELIDNRMKSQKTTFETLKSENEDIDVTETVIDLKSAEMTYEAALMATGKVMQTTLLNFI
ncbi:MAG: flagellar hook-associated protein FlgL [Waltera sp.]|uniref:flagellar hook-associated protein FlgL n=2 Tax=Waltera sp. TaxID=2815806 RepID=UPI001D065510|nr:flagellar hook-associated protein FlgL [Lacrimispora saccharolytica]MCG4781730.1 flagellar hook-associated protein FlgL [Acetatifactor sp. DFI.5.50]